MCDTDKKEDTRYVGMSPSVPGLWYCPVCGIGWYRNDTPRHVESIQRNGKCLTCCERRRTK
jgi:hypothetical protein